MRLLLITGLVARQRLSSKSWRPSGFLGGLYLISVIFLFRAPLLPLRRSQTAPRLRADYRWLRARNGIVVPLVCAETTITGEIDRRIPALQRRRHQPHIRQLELPDVGATIVALIFFAPGRVINVDRRPRRRGAFFEQISIIVSHYETPPAMVYLTGSSPPLVASCSAGALAVE